MIIALILAHILIKIAEEVKGEIGGTGAWSKARARANARAARWVADKRAVHGARDPSRWALETGVGLYRVARGIPRAVRRGWRIGKAIGRGFAAGWSSGRQEHQKRIAERRAAAEAREAATPEPSPETPADEAEPDGPSDTAEPAAAPDPAPAGPPAEPTPTAATAATPAGATPATPAPTNQGETLTNTDTAVASSMPEIINFDTGLAALSHLAAVAADLQTAAATASSQFTAHGVDNGELHGCLTSFAEFMALAAARARRAHDVLLAQRVVQEAVTTVGGSGETATKVEFFDPS